MNKQLISPFHLSGPVSPERFIGRDDEIDTMFTLIQGGHSLLLVGEPKIGKSSIIKFMKSAEIRSKKLEDYDHRCIFCEFDGHSIISSTTPCIFWNRVLTQFTTDVRFIGPSTSALQLTIREYIQANHYEPGQLYAIFETLRSMEYRIVILIHEFDALLTNRFFLSTDFLAPLRAVCTSAGSVSLIATSRLRLIALMERIPGNNDSGSPVLNHFIEQFIGPFRTREVDLLLDTYLETSDVEFPGEARTLVHQLGGCLPFLVQTVATEVYRRLRAGEPLDTKHIVSNLADGLDAYFTIIWHGLDDPSRSVSAALSQCGNSAKLATGLPDVVLQQCLQRLRRAGLVVSRKKTYGDFPYLFEQDDSYLQISSQLFAYWVNNLRQNSHSHISPSYQQCVFSRMPQLFSFKPDCGGSEAAGRKACPLNSSVVRRMLNEVLKDVAAFDAFCMDHFAKTYRILATGMDRTSRENALLTRESLDDILFWLATDFPGHTPTLQALLRTALSGHRF